MLGHASVAGSTSVAPDVVAGALDDGGRRLIAIAVAVSALGILDTQLLTDPRLIYALALDGFTAGENEPWFAGENGPLAMAVA